MFEWVDVTMLGCSLDLFGFNFGKSSSESKQESGLRGTEYFNDDTAGLRASALADTKNLQMKLTRLTSAPSVVNAVKTCLTPASLAWVRKPMKPSKKMMSYSLGRMSAEGAGQRHAFPEKHARRRGECDETGASAVAAPDLTDGTVDLPVARSGRVRCCSTTRTRRTRLPVPRITG